jgi:hypothetical protein
VCDFAGIFQTTPTSKILIVPSGRKEVLKTLPSGNANICVQNVYSGREQTDPFSVCIFSIEFPFKIAFLKCLPFKEDQGVENTNHFCKFCPTEKLMSPLSAFQRKADLHRKARDGG